jgi:uncharacterized membrane protein
MSYDYLIISAAHGIELAGVVVLLFGGLLASGIFIKRLLNQVIFQDAYHELRADLGRAILLGLELLVIADIIGTVAIEPTLKNLGVLAVIVVIRTVLSFTLELEVSGCWPWNRGPVTKHSSPETE